MKKSELRQIIREELHEVYMSSGLRQALSSTPRKDTHVLMTRDGHILDTIHSPLKTNAGAQKAVKWLVANDGFDKDEIAIVRIKTGKVDNDYWFKGFKGNVDIAKKVEEFLKEK